MKPWMPRVCGLVLMAVVASEGVASATESDTVILKNGTVLRGTVTEVVTGATVTIFANGRNVICPWSLVLVAKRGDETFVDSAKPPAEQPADSSAKVIVHIEGDGLALRAVTGETVCVAPCDQAVAADRKVRIVGEGIRPTSAFTFKGARSPNVTLRVEPAPTSAFVGGLVAAGTGAAAIGTGVFLLFFSIRCSNRGAFELSCGTLPGPRNAGYVSLVAGAVLLAVGIPMFVGNRKSEVTDGFGIPLAPIEKKKKERKAESAEPRVAEYGRDEAHILPMPPMTTAPFFSQTF